MLVSALILSFLNATISYPPTLQQAQVVAYSWPIQTTPQSLPITQPPANCTYAMSPPEGSLLQTSAGFAFLCRAAPAGQFLNSSTPFQFVEYSTSADSWSTTPLEIPPIQTPFGGAKLSWTRNDESIWLLVNVPGPSSPASGGGGSTAGNSGTTLSCIYSIRPPPLLSVTLVFNTTQYTLQDIQVNPTGLYSLATTSTSSPGGGVSPLQTTVLKWTAPPLTPDMGGAFLMLPGTLQARSIQAFLAPTLTTPLIFMTYTTPPSFESWLFNDTLRQWALVQSAPIRRAAAVLQIHQIDMAQPYYALTGQRVYDAVILNPLSESALLSIPASVPQVFRSSLRAQIQNNPSRSASPSALSSASISSSFSPSPSTSSTATGTSEASASTSSSATATPKYLRIQSESATSTSTSVSTPTPVITPVLYTPTPTSPFTQTPIPTPHNGPFWPTPTPSPSPTKMSLLTPTPTPSLSPPPAAAVAIPIPPLSPGEAAGVSITVLILGGSLLASLWFFRAVIQNYLVSKGLWKSTKLRRGIRRTVSYSQNTTARPMKQSAPISITNNPAFMIQRDTTAVRIPSQEMKQQLDSLHELRSDRFKKEFGPKQIQTGASV